MSSTTAGVKKMVEGTQLKLKVLNSFFKKNLRLRKAISYLTLGKLILHEAAKGNN
jgi:hypothetical protein